MYANWKPFLSVLGVPLIGLGTLLFSLGHPIHAAKTDSNDGPMMFLVDPDPKLDPSLTICLRQQAKMVTHFRHQSEPQRLTQAIADYNLVARECSPTVFQATHLPTYLEPE